MTEDPAASSFIVDGKRVRCPEGLACRGTFDPSAPRLSSSRRRTHVTELVVHESVTRSAGATVRVLRMRRLGVHLVLDPEGELSQHADLVRDVVAHAGSTHNGPSIGVEVVNPYYPRLLRPGLAWGRTIRAPWAHEGRYVLPTPAQAESVAMLVRWLTSGPVPGIAVPRRWVGLADGRMALGRVADARRASAGILAHHYFGHSDGAWLVLYAWLRLEADAFEEAVRRAEGARGFADLRDLISTPMA